MGVVGLRQWMEKGVQGKVCILHLQYVQAVLDD